MKKDETGKTPRTEADEVLLKQHMNAVLGTLAALDGFASDALDADIRQTVNHDVLDAMIALGSDLDAGTSRLARQQGAQLGNHYLGLQHDDAAARRHLGLPAKPTPPAADATMLAMSAKLDALMERTVAVSAKEAVPAKSKAPRFSEAADAYIKTLTDAHGSHHRELGYLRHRKAIFIAIMGDLPVDQIGKRELQRFVNEAAHISPNFSRQLNYKAGEVVAHIKANRADGGRGLSRKTLLDAYLSRVKTIIRNGLENAGLPYTLTGTTLVIPNSAPASKKTRSVEAEDFKRALAYAIDNDRHNDALLLLLGRLTGRRLSSLAFLRCEDFERRGDVWVFQPQSHMVIDGRWSAVPLKTEQSTDECVLHRLFTEIGLTKWVEGRTGFLFPSYHQAENPSNAVQKKIDYVLEEIGPDAHLPRRVKQGSKWVDVKRRKAFTFHALRHTRINDMRAAQLADRVIRMQVGHAQRDEHDRYGELQATERSRLAELTLPDGVTADLVDRISVRSL